LDKIYIKLGFNKTEDEIYKQLVLARIIEPASKLDTIRILKNLGIQAPTNTGIHRCMKRIYDCDYRSIISELCFDNSYKEALKLVLYDVTTLYFEIQKEDEYRKPGLSKERRLEPQIIIGLLVDSRGFPLEIQSFEGNKAEVHTIIPILRGFRERHKLNNITVTADAAMLSAKNIEILERLGYHYIIGSRIARTPYEIETYLTDEETKLNDKEIFETTKVITVEGKRTKRREIFQYKEKRASLDLRNIEKTIKKAQNNIDKKSNIKRNRFLKVKEDKRQLNFVLIEEARKRAGIKGYITDLKIPAEQVIDSYHQLFEVEKSFRMSKFDLEARPIHHHTRESIESHLTIVFTALAIARYIEAKTKISIRKFIKTLEPIRTVIIAIGDDFIQIQGCVPKFV